MIGMTKSSPEFRLRALIDNIQPNQLDNISYSQLFSENRSKLFEIIQEDKSQLIKLVEAIKKLSKPCFSRDCLLALTYDLILGENDIIESIFIDPFTDIPNNSLLWRNLANTLTTIPDLFAALGVIKKFPRCKHEAFLNHLLIRVYDSLNILASSKESLQNEHKLLLFQVIGRAAFLDNGEIVFKHIIYPAMNDERTSSEIRTLIRDLYQLPFQLAETEPSFECFIGPLHVQPFYLSVPDETLGYRLRRVLGEPILTNKSLEYLICNKILLQRNYNLDHSLQYRILLNIGLYLQDIISDNSLQPNTLVIDCYMRVVKSWSDRTRILFTSVEYNRFVTCCLVILSRFLFKTSSAKDEILKKGPEIQSLLMKGIHIYLDRASNDHHHLAISIAELILPELHKLMDSGSGGYGKESASKSITEELKFNQLDNEGTETMRNVLKDLYSLDLGLLVEKFLKISPRGSSANDMMVIPNSMTAITPETKTSTASMMKSTSETSQQIGGFPESRPKFVADGQQVVSGDDNDNDSSLGGLDDRNRQGSGSGLLHKDNNNRKRANEAGEKKSTTPNDKNDDDHDDDDKNHKGSCSQDQKVDYDSCTDDEDFDNPANKMKAPIYLSDCIEGLRENDKPGYVRLCLIKAGVLVRQYMSKESGDLIGNFMNAREISQRRRPPLKVNVRQQMMNDKKDDNGSLNGGSGYLLLPKRPATSIYQRMLPYRLSPDSKSSLASTSALSKLSATTTALSTTRPETNSDTIGDSAIELARVLLYLDDLYLIDNFNSMRLDTLTTLCIAQPDVVGKFLLDEFNGTARNFRHQLEILQILIGSSKQLSSTHSHSHLSSSQSQSPSTTMIINDNTAKNNDNRKQHAGGGSAVSCSPNKAGIDRQAKGISANNFSKYAPLYFYGIVERLKVDLGASAGAGSKRATLISLIKETISEGNNGGGNHLADQPSSSSSMIAAGGSGGQSIYKKLVNGLDRSESHLAGNLSSCGLPMLLSLATSQARRGRKLTASAGRQPAVVMLMNEDDDHETNTTSTSSSSTNITASHGSCKKSAAADQDQDQDEDNGDEDELAAAGTCRLRPAQPETIDFEAVDEEENGSRLDNSYLLSRIFFSLSVLLECVSQQPICCKLSQDLMDYLVPYRSHPDVGVKKAIWACLCAIRSATPRVYFEEHLADKLLNLFADWLQANQLANY